MATAPPRIDRANLRRLIERERDRLLARTPGSQAAYERAVTVMPRGVPSSFQAADPRPLYLSHGAGARVWDVDGNEYVDFHNGFGVMAVGHAHPRIVAAVTERAGRGSHFAAPTDGSIAVARALRARFGLPQWRFTNSGTESTMDAIHLARGSTDRKVIVKIEGTYHGHHDALMVSVFPGPEDAGPADHPNSVPQSKGIPKAFVDLVVNVPFNDAGALERVFAEHPGRIAGMIVEPVMTNCGVVLPDQGYLQRLKDICHANDAMLAYDEVKTGFTTAWGGAIEAFGVQPDLVAYAKALGGGLPCGAIGGTREAMRMVIDGDLDQVGTFNGNPLTMAAAKVNLTEVLTKDAYGRLDEVNAILDGCNDVIERYRLPASMKMLGAKGSIDWRSEPIHSYRDLWEIDDRVPQLAWLWQLNRGVFKSPGSKWESWTTSIVMSDEDARRYVENFESLAQAITG